MTIYLTNKSKVTLYILSFPILIPHRYSTPMPLIINIVWIFHFRIFTLLSTVFFHVYNTWPKATNSTVNIAENVFSFTRPRNSIHDNSTMRLKLILQFLQQKYMWFTRSKPFEKSKSASISYFFFGLLMASIDKPTRNVSMNQIFRRLNPYCILSRRERQSSNEGRSVFYYSTTTCNCPSCNGTSYFDCHDIQHIRHFIYFDKPILAAAFQGLKF